jgi:hypothetical protein
MTYLRTWIFHRRPRSRALHIQVLVLAALSLLAPSTIATADPSGKDGRKYTFGLWGDMPYTAEQNLKIPALIDDMNAAKLAFSVFDGDIKSGSSLCTDDVYTTAIARFNTFKAPMIYVPGDNEWTDCHRLNNGGYDNLERLDHIRQTMFATPYSFGQKQLLLDHQGPPRGLYAENTHWIFARVVYVGLNIPGSNNNKVNSAAECTNKSARTPAQCDADNAEYAARDAANIEWLKESFQIARDNEALAVMIIIQADPSFDLPETESFNERTQVPGFDGYDKFLAALTAETQAFSGQVVLVHGDTHFFKVDKPLINQANLLDNFTRVETFGSPNIHWVQVTVDPKSRNIFTFEPMIVLGN